MRALYTPLTKRPPGAVIELPPLDQVSTFRSEHRTYGVSLEPHQDAQQVHLLVPLVRLGAEGSYVSVTSC